MSLPCARYVEYNCAETSFRSYLLAVIRPTCCIPLFRQIAARTTSFPFYYTLSSFSMFTRSCRCLVPGMSKTNLQKFHAEVNCIGCDTSYIVLHSTFSSIRLKDNSVSANVAQGQIHFPSTTPLVLSQYLSRSCRCLVPGMSKTNLQKFHAEVNCIGCDTSWNALRSTFSSICLKDNSVSLLLHSHFFLNVYRGRVAIL